MSIHLYVVTVDYSKELTKVFISEDKAKVYLAELVMDESEDITYAPSEIELYKVVVDDAPEQMTLEY